MVVEIRDHDHFEALNDFICFKRQKVKDYVWFHRGLSAEDCSTLTVEFFNVHDALMFKLTHG